MQALQHCMGSQILNQGCSVAGSSVCPVQALGHGVGAGA